MTARRRTRAGAGTAGPHASARGVAAGARERGGAGPAAPAATAATATSDGPARGTRRQEVAAKLMRLIDQGALRAGDRMPSVRRLAAEQRVSVTTAIEAYRYLESLGVVAARPQSGFYVRGPLPEDLALPRTPRTPTRPTAVSVPDLAMSMIRDSRSPRLVPFGAGVPSPDLLPTAALNRMLGRIVRRSVEGANYYAGAAGTEALRIQVAKLALSWGCEAGPDDIVTTHGAQDAMQLCLRAVTKPGDCVAIDSPAYYGTLQALSALGLEVVEIPMVPGGGGADLDALRTALGRHAVKAYVGSPNYGNPHGGILSDARKAELVALLRARGTPFIEDDLYGDLGHSGERPRPCKAWDTDGLVLLVSSFSKTLAPGWRVGWAMPGRFRARVEQLKFASTLATAPPGELAIAEYLSTGGYERFLRRVRAEYARRTAAMIAAIGRTFPAGTRVSRPRGGFVVWVELPPENDAMELYGAALADGVNIAPGPLFSARGGFRNFIRVNASRWSPEAERGLALVARHLRRA